MRFVAIDNLNTDMVLGLGIMGIVGHFSLRAGMQLSDSFIHKLSEDGYQGIFIKDAISKDIDVDDRFYGNRYASGTDLIKTKKIFELSRLSSFIVDDVIRFHPERISILHIQAFDDYQFYHAINTTIYSTIIGYELGLDREGLYLLAKAAILHDIGMADVSEDILNKPESLTDTERKQMALHVNNGCELLKKAGIEDLIVDAIRYHHENENGSGYPYAVTSDDIPDFAKIIHVADVLDAMTTKKRYKEAYLPADVLEYLSSGSGILFHEDVVNAALNKFDAYPVGITVSLSDERAALVYSRSSNNFRPNLLMLDTKEKVLFDKNPLYQNITIKGTISPETVDNTSENTVLIKKQSIRGGRKKIVVVDDMFICRRTVEAALSFDYDVVLFDNANEAISYIKRNEIDLLIMDIEMPGMDGVTAVRTLRLQGFTELPVIFLTSINDKKTIMDCVSVHACDYILKPIKQIYIYERVNEAMKQK